MDATCKKCGKSVFRRELCVSHYTMASRRGALRVPSVLDRIIVRSTIDRDGCWRVTDSRLVIKNGYAVLRVNGRSEYVHRVAYELFHGPIPDGLTIDHLCRVRTCWRPHHLEAVTLAENGRRGWEWRDARHLAAEDCEHKQCSRCRPLRAAA